MCHGSGIQVAGAGRRTCTACFKRTSGCGRQVCQIANYLRSVGVKRGDDVTIYMPMIPELPAAMVRPRACTTYNTLVMMKRWQRWLYVRAAV